MTNLYKYGKIERIFLVRKMKLNKKGFTLVELLVVLVILVIIMTIAIPSVTSSIERSKHKQRDSMIELVVSAAELYVDRHKNSYNGDSTYTITISEIICDGVLTKEQVKDPLNESYTLSGYVLYTKSSNSYDWKDMPDNDSYRLKIEDSLTC